MHEPNDNLIMKKIGLALFMLTVTVSCKKADDAFRKTDAPKSDLGANLKYGDADTAYVESFSANASLYAVYNDSTKITSIYALQADGCEIQINLTSINVGTYTDFDSKDSLKKNSMHYSTVPFFTFTVYGAVKNTGNVTITSLTKDSLISGKFKFRGYGFNDFRPADTIRIIKDGVFKYIKIEHKK